MKKIFVLLLVLLYPALLFAADNNPAIEGRPHWSFEVKGGVLYPAIDNFKQFYGHDYTGRYGLAFSYKLLRMLEIGAEGSYVNEEGEGFAPLHGAAAGSVKYELFPVNVFVLFRGVFNENQWVVPYVGGGYSYIYYREEIQAQPTVSGHAHGFHGRAGLQFLLDGLDRNAASSFYRDVGVYHTYLFGEAQYTRAMAHSTNLGGWTYWGGLLFEF